MGLARTHCTARVRPAYGGRCRHWAPVPAPRPVPGRTPGASGAPKSLQQGRGKSQSSDPYVPQPHNGDEPEASTPTLYFSEPRSGPRSAEPTPGLCFQAGRRGRREREYRAGRGEVAGPLCCEGPRRWWGRGCHPGEGRGPCGSAKPQEESQGQPQGKGEEGRAAAGWAQAALWRVVKCGGGGGVRLIGLAKGLEKKTRESGWTPPCPPRALTRLPWVGGSSSQPYCPVPPAWQALPLQCLHCPFPRGTCGLCSPGRFSFTPCAEITVVFGVFPKLSSHRCPVLFLAFRDWG